MLAGRAAVYHDRIYLHVAVFRWLDRAILGS